MYICRRESEPWRSRALNSTFHYKSKVNIAHEREEKEGLIPHLIHKTEAEDDSRYEEQRATPLLSALTLASGVWGVWRGYLAPVRGIPIIRPCERRSS